MPADWKKLAEETAHSFDPDEVLGMWSVDWRKAREAFFEDYRLEIEAEPRRFRRGLRKANAVVYGLTRRLAPPRRLVFALALVLVVLALLENASGDRSSGLAFLGLLVAVLALMFLLAMELVDKLHFKDELVMARALQAAARPAAAARDRVLRARGREPRREHRRRRPLRLRAAARRARRGPVRRRVGPRDGGGPRDGRDARGLPDAARRRRRRPRPWPSSLNRVLCETGSSRSFFAGICGLLEADGGVHRDRGGPPGRPEAGRRGPRRRADRDGVVSSRHQEDDRVDAPVDDARARRDAALPLRRPARGARRERRGLRRRADRGGRGRQERRAARRARRGPRRPTSTGSSAAFRSTTTSRSRRSAASRRDGRRRAAPRRPPDRGRGDPLVDGRPRDQARAALRRRRRLLALVRGGDLPPRRLPPVAREVAARGAVHGRRLRAHDPDVRVRDEDDDGRERDLPAVHGAALRPRARAVPPEGAVPEGRRGGGRRGARRDVAVLRREAGPRRARGKPRRGASRASSSA